MAGTYTNQQGKTVRNMGHTIDFSKPDYFTHDEYTQHVYMILGRATCLEWSLFRNLPMLEDGSDIDFTVFEHGPPGYIAQFLKRLEDCNIILSLVVTVLLLHQKKIKRYGPTCYLTVKYFK